MTQRMTQPGPRVSQPAPSCARDLRGGRHFAALEEPERLARDVRAFFVIVASLAPRLEAGAPLPAGRLQVMLSPHLTLGPP